MTMGLGWGMPVVRAGKEAHAKDVGHMLSLEHHASTVRLGKAPQAHLSTSGTLDAVQDLKDRSVLLRWALQTSVSTAQGLTLRSSEAEARKVPFSFQHTRLTHPSWPSRRCSTDNLRAKTSLYGDNLPCSYRFPSQRNWLSH